MVVSLIDKTLLRFMQDMKDVLGASLADVVIHGSVVLGDFRPGQGDIDYLVVTRGDLDEQTNRRIFEQHDRYRVGKELLLHQVEGTFYPMGFISELKGAFVGCYIGTTKKYWRTITTFQNSHMDLRIIHDFGRHMLGEAIRIYNPTDAELRAEQLQDLSKQLASAKEGAESGVGYWMSVIHWCARTLYYLETGSVTSKAEGCRWCQGAVGREQFRRLFAEAEDKRYPYGGEAVDGNTAAACTDLLGYVGDQLSKHEISSGEE